MLTDDHTRAQTIAHDATLLPPLRTGLAAIGEAPRAPTNDCWTGRAKLKPKAARPFGQRAVTCARCQRPREQHAHKSAPAHRHDRWWPGTGARCRPWVPGGWPAHEKHSEIAQHKHQQGSTAAGGPLKRAGYGRKIACGDEEGAPVQRTSLRKAAP